MGVARSSDRRPNSKDDWLGTLSGILAAMTSQQFSEPASNVIGVVMAFFSRLLFQIPDATGISPSNATWTVRNARTGDVRKITAASEKEFQERLAVEAFDKR